MIRGRQAVVDASVALKWRLDDEEHLAQAVALRDDLVRREMVVLAPTLLAYEVANGLIVASRRGRLLVLGVGESLEAILNVGIQLATPDWTRTCRFAEDYGITGYDSAYLALADTRGCELWTGDRALFDTVEGALTWVRWIGDYGRD